MIVKIDQRLHTLLIRDDLDNFTAAEVRDMYVKPSLSTEELNPVHAWKKIYRQLNRLVSRGLLIKQASAQQRQRTYTKTPEFQKAVFKLSDLPEPPGEAKGSDTSDDADISLLNRLRDRAKQHQVDLSASIGESEEYMHLYNFYPALKSQLESEYLRARERSSKLLGQLRAIEIIIAQYEI